MAAKTSKNDITGDSIQSRASTKAYEEGWDRIFGKKDDETIEKNIPIPPSNILSDNPPTEKR
jgi:hypothetical protein